MNEWNGGYVYVFYALLVTYLVSALIYECPVQEFISMFPRDQRNQNLKN